MSSRLTSSPHPAAPAGQPLQALTASASSLTSSNAAERARSAAWQRWKMGDVGQLTRPGLLPDDLNRNFDEQALAVSLGTQGLRSARQPLDAGLYGRDGSAPTKVHEPLSGLSPLQPGLLMDEAELARLRQLAQDAGHAEGLREGLREGRALGEQQAREAIFNESRQAAAHWAALTHSLPRALAAADAALAEKLVSLAMSLAQQVLGQSLALQPEAVLSAVRELLNTEPVLTGQPQLWLHPDDALLVKEHLSEELQDSGWRVRTDALMERGGCRVQAVSGEVDATLPTRWARLASLLGQHAEAKA